MTKKKLMGRPRGVTALESGVLADVAAHKSPIESDTVGYIGARQIWQVLRFRVRMDQVWGISAVRGRPLYVTFAPGEIADILSQMPFDGLDEEERDALTRTIKLFRERD